MPKTQANSNVPDAFLGGARRGNVFEDRRGGKIESRTAGVETHGKTKRRVGNSQLQKKYVPLLLCSCSELYKEPHQNVHQPHTQPCVRHPRTHTNIAAASMPKEQRVVSVAIATRK